MCLQDDKTLLLWDTATGKPVWQLEQPDTKDRVAVSPDGKYLGVALADGKAAVLEAVAGKKVHTFETGKNDEIALAFSPDSALLATSAATLWDISTGIKQREFSSPEDFTPRAIAFSHDGKMVAASSFGQVVVFASATVKPLSRYKADFDVRRRGLSFAAADKTLVVGIYPGSPNPGTDFAEHSDLNRSKLDARQKTRCGYIEWS